MRTTSDSLTATGVHGEDHSNIRYKVRQIGFVVTTAVVGPTTAPVVEFNRRPTAGSAAGEVVVGTLTIPDGTAAGKVLYKNVTPVLISQGEGLAAEVITAATGGTPAGVGFYFYVADADPETAANESDMIASA
jgi:hypothetical protein